MSDKITIKSFSGLKTLSLLLIFWWHSSIPSPSVDLGARCCELFFVISGFLIGITKKDSFKDCSWGESIKYTLKKVFNIFPLHVLVLLLQIPINRDIENGFLKFIIKLFFLDSWSNNQDIFFAFNGSSWFISSLLFCYFISPILIKLLNSKIKSVILFFVAIFFRFLIEFISYTTELNYLNVFIHVNPIVRFLEFSSGLFISHFYFTIKQKLEDKNERKIEIIFSFFEVISFLLILAICVINPIKYRVFYVVIFLLFILVFAFDKGILSVFFSLKPFTLFSKIQFEFYLSHTTYICYFNFIVNYFICNDNIAYLVGINVFAIFILIMLCQLYKFFFNKLLKNKVETLYIKIIDILQI